MVELSDFLEEDLERLFAGETPKKLLAKARRCLTSTVEGFIGNAAGADAIMALLGDEYKHICEEIAKTGRHVELGSPPVFFERYIAKS